MVSVSTVALFLSWSRLLAALLPVSAAVSAGDPHVHVVSTICGKDYVAKTMPMLRSLLWHRTSPLTLHIIADRPGAYSSCPGLHPRLCIAVCAARVQLQKVFGNGWYAKSTQSAACTTCLTTPVSRDAPHLEVDYIKAETHMARVEDSMPANFFTNMGSCSTA
jgi:hypothetical protein|eukprot:SAG25_NODE_3438_length_1083_cov_1.128049_2_plen_163_part_00